MKKTWFLLALITYYLVLPRSVFAEYVLPYPSYMPGNTLYKITRITDILKGYWYFGNIAQIRYHLGLSDKYLVEAKTLMEYKQYLLGDDALNRSNKEFSALPAYIEKTKHEYTDISSFQKTIGGAAAAHDAVLQKLETMVPVQFTWTPEKSTATQLFLQKDIEQARALRQEVLSQINR